MTKTFITFIVLLAITATAGSASADIYRLESEGDAVTFTDSPSDKRFQLIMKEQQVRRPQKQSARSSDDKQSGNTAGNLPIQGRITSTTGMRSDPFDGKLRHHNGLDIAAPTGTPVKPVAPGTVMFSGWKNGYGNTVILEHDDGMVTVYAHHAANNVSEGAVVGIDTIIALSGSTGRSTGPHLHFEAWRGGENITTQFMPGGMRADTGSASAASPINRYLQSDGTIIFTNLR
jgi:murein DD-endopeptidase MepM/ murein hydrolase activator NlpD